MSALSRRSRSRIAATLAVPAVAVAACAEADPVFAAIEACLETEQIYAEAWARFEQARDRFTEKEGTNLTHSPKPLAKAGPEHEWLKEFSKAGCDSHQTVDRLIDDMYRKGGKDLGGKSRYLHEELDRQTAADNETVKPLDEANTGAHDRFDHLFQTMIDTQPTTLPGLAALVCLSARQ
jgi:hypothetical protein